MNRVYLIKPYNPYVPAAENETIKYIYTINEQQFCIVETVLDWGKPQVGLSIDQEDNYGFYLYNNYEDALEYVKLIKRLAR